MVNIKVIEGGVVNTSNSKRGIYSVAKQYVFKAFGKLFFNKDNNSRIDKSTIYEYIVDLLYPRRCPVCDEVLPVGDSLCDKCKDQFIVVNDSFCKKCGKIVKDNEEYCYDCSNKHFSYKEGRGVFLYNSHMKESISRFKYYGRCEYADYYVDKIVDTLGYLIRQWGIDTIIPVPIHKNKLKFRGFNQAEIIATRLGKRLGINVLAEALVRIEDTKPQKGLDNISRRKNLINAISINNDINIPNCVNNILLIDDIYTTGATINACSKRLKSQNHNYNIYFVSVAIGNGF